MSKVQDEVKKVLGARSRWDELRWTNTRKGGRAVLRSPDGRIYYGTAAEVRDAGLAPARRNSLLNSLRCLHRAFAVGSIGADDLRECAASRRRDAIREGGYDFRMKHWVGLFPLRDLIRIRAAARSQGVDAAAFVERLAMAAVADAEAKCGGRLRQRGGGGVGSVSGLTLRGEYGRETGRGSILPSRFLSAFQGGFQGGVLPRQSGLPRP